MTQMQAANKFLQCEGIQHEAWAPFAEGQNDIYKKVSFTNRYGIRLVGDLYMPKNRAGKLPAIAVCGPYGAVKEQASGEIYTEDYSAAVDFFMLQPEVDRERIGILGICGFGGISINAAVQDTRIKATVSSTMGAFDPYDKEQRYEMRRQLNEQRTADLLFASGVTGGFRQIERRQQGGADYSRCKSYRLV